jgi:hypothetical protein
MRNTLEVQTGDVFIEATVKVRVHRNVTLYTEDSEEYLLEAMYDGDIEVIETKVDKFEVTDVEVETDYYED